MLDSPDLSYFYGLAATDGTCGDQGLLDETFINV
jgi:hypothetical protein